MCLPEARNQELHPGLPQGVRGRNSSYLQAISRDLSQKWSSQDTKALGMSAPHTSAPGTGYVIVPYQGSKGLGMSASQVIVLLTVLECYLPVTILKTLYLVFVCLFVFASKQ